MCHNILTPHSGLGLVLIGFSVSGGLLVSHFVFFLAALELSLMGYVFWLSSQKITKDIIFVYFLIQALGSGVLFLAFFSFGEGFSGQGLKVISLVLKLGLPPFHGWFLWLSKGVDYLSLSLLCTLQKVLPAVALILTLPPKGATFLVFLGVGFGGWGLFQEKKTKLVIALSSIISTSWVIVTREKTSLVLSYFVLLSLGLLVLSRNLQSENKEVGGSAFYRAQLSWALLTSLNAVLAMSGLPPSATFGAKVQICLSAFLSGESSSVLVLLIGSFVAFYALVRSQALAGFSAKQVFFFTGAGAVGSLSVGVNLVLVWFFL